MISKEDLDRIQAYWENATQGEMNTIHITADMNPVEWFRQCLEKSGEKDMYGLACGKLENIEQGEKYTMTAFTGNGPTSLANAEFYAVCHMVIPILVEEIRNLQNRLEYIEDQDLPGGDA